MLTRSIQFVLGLGFAPTAPSPENSAAWITAAKAWPFVVQEAQYPDPSPHEVVIKSAAVAINPVDWKIQSWAGFDLAYPHILGEDVAGEVVKLGSAVESLKIGDRVAA